MLKYVNTQVTFSEIPDQITLCIEISNCPIHCPECHSKYLWKDIGTPLNKESLLDLISKNEGITCVCLLGGDQAITSINWLAKCIKEFNPELSVAWYSGQSKLDKDINLEYFDYIKLGPYIEECGPLNNPNTNQRLYCYSKYYSDFTIDKGWRDITYKFWQNDSNL